VDAYGRLFEIDERLMGLCVLPLPHRTLHRAPILGGAIRVDHLLDAREPFGVEGGWAWHDVKRTRDRRRRLFIPAQEESVSGKMIPGEWEPRRRPDPAVAVPKPAPAPAEIKK
jgi:hypothetical protein